tara:strand:+ start:831 stop:1403 length:573 start_codon:yes stop_codon:yes gene_type:complete
MEILELLIIVVCVCIILYAIFNQNKKGEHFSNVFTRLKPDYYDIQRLNKNKLIKSNPPFLAAAAKAGTTGVYMSNQGSIMKGARVIINPNEPTAELVTVGNVYEKGFDATRPLKYDHKEMEIVVTLYNNVHYYKKQNIYRPGSATTKEFRAWANKELQDNREMIDSLSPGQISKWVDTDLAGLEQREILI